MLKQIISYENYDGEQKTTTAWFNLTRIELADNLELQEEFEEIVEWSKEPERNLTIPEVKKILDLVKRLAELSYGVRSEDGERFIKTPEAWVEFTQTAAYDAFLFNLFQEPTKGTAFLQGIIPKQLLEEAKAQQATAVPSGETNAQGDFTKKALTEMSRDELLAAMREKNAE